MVASYKFAGSLTTLPKDYLDLNLIYSANSLPIGIDIKLSNLEGDVRKIGSWERKDSAT